jgi:DNA-binding FadR family transcriptional regulator
MTVSSISPSLYMYQPAQNSMQNNVGQSQNEFQALGNALQSGDLSGAQTAFAALQQMFSTSSTGNQTQTSQQGGGQNSFSSDFDALGQALQSGDLKGAQTDFAKLLQNIQTTYNSNGSSTSGSSGNVAATNNVNFTI